MRMRHPASKRLTKPQKARIITDPHVTSMEGEPSRGKVIGGNPEFWAVREPSHWHIHETPGNGTPSEKNDVESVRYAGEAETTIRTLHDATNKPEPLEPKSRGPEPRKGKANGRDAYSEHKRDEMRALRQSQEPYRRGQE